MRQLLLFFIMICNVLLYPSECIGWQKKPAEFYIIFGSGFKSDTISLFINDVKIASQIVLNSNPITGIGEGASIQFKNNHLMIFDQKLNLLESKPFQKTNRIKIIIHINDLPYELVAVFKKGKYIVISKHWYYYSVYLNQYKKPVVFE
ncbi:MAG TPA: hypothetical protein PKD85_18940 [Saprospiraceae bacterium]|nr:hypothetical protein [Saprospiraceae bacterium]